MNETHLISTWILYFYVYSFIGWIWESCYVSVCQKKWVNRGFIKGPLLPLYGSGAVVMLLVSRPFADNLVLVYFSGTIAATILEYITGALMEALFKVRYWDYSDQKFNLNGYICLSSSVVWGFFTILMTEYVHPAVIYLLSFIPPIVQNTGLIIITVGFLYDFIMAFQNALQFRWLLEKLAAAREELLELSDKLESSLKDNFSTVRTTFAGGDKNTIRQQLAALPGMLERFASELKSSRPETSFNISERLTQWKEQFSRLTGSITDRQRKLLKNHSHTVSKKYTLELELLKERLRENGKKK